MKTPFRHWLGAAVIAVIAIGGPIIAVTTGGGGGGSSANVFVATTGNDATCARGNSSLPCLTFQKACSIANGGDTVEVAAGSYVPQTVTCTPTSLVTFAPATGATVIVGGWANLGTTATYVAGSGGYTLDFQSGQTTGGFPQPATVSIGSSSFTCTTRNTSSLSGCTANFSGGVAPFKFYAGADIGTALSSFDATNLEFRDMAINGISLASVSDTLTFRNITGHKIFQSGSSNAISWIGGSFGGNTTGVIAQLGWPSSDATNISFDGTAFHDADCSASGGTPPNNCHTEAMHVSKIVGVTLRRMKFTNIEQYDVSMQTQGGTGTVGDATNVTVEDNYFGCTWTIASPGSGNAPTKTCGTDSFPAFNVVLQTNNATYSIRNNTVEGDDILNIDPTTFAFTSTTINGNLGNYNFNTCALAGVTCAYNVWSRSSGCPQSNETNATCGTTVNSQMTASSTGPQLTGTSVARAKVPVALCPADDFYGNVRPLPSGATNCDAGASEVS